MEGLNPYIGISSSLYQGHSPRLYSYYMLNAAEHEIYSAQNQMLAIVAI